MRRRRRAREGQKKRKRESSQPFLKKLCAALLRSFRGQHSKKMKRSAWGNWDLQKGQQPFGPNPNGVGDRTTTLRRLLIGAAKKSKSPAMPQPWSWRRQTKHFEYSDYKCLLFYLRFLSFFDLQSNIRVVMNKLSIYILMIHLA